MFSRKLLLVVFIVACLFAAVDLTFFVLNLFIDLEEKWTEFFGDFLTDTIIAMLAWEYRKEKRHAERQVELETWIKPMLPGGKKVSADRIIAGSITAENIQAGRIESGWPPHKANSPWCPPGCFGQFEDCAYKEE